MFDRVRRSPAVAVERTILALAQQSVDDAGHSGDDGQGGDRRRLRDLAVEHDDSGGDCAGPGLTTSSKRSSSRLTSASQSISLATTFRVDGMSSCSDARVHPSLGPARCPRLPWQGARTARLRFLGSAPAVQFSRPALKHRAFRKPLNELAHRRRPKAATPWVDGTITAPSTSKRACIAASP
jgi:hypothetical protein